MKKNKHGYTSLRQLRRVLALMLALLLLAPANLLTVLADALPEDASAPMQEVLEQPAAEPEAETVTQAEPAEEPAAEPVIAAEPATEPAAESASVEPEPVAAAEPEIAAEPVAEQPSEPVAESEPVAVPDLAAEPEPASDAVA